MGAMCITMEVILGVPRRPGRSRHQKNNSVEFRRRVYAERRLKQRRALIGSMAVLGALATSPAQWRADSSESAFTPKGDGAARNPSANPK